ncbi:hypothetical protein Ahy_B05g075241 [Arachis hypogaea]|uniref:Pentatricopeptide repeat-containing protein n=1 Tax=Arachis hypogaea TaxID=3818 RepID=A0A444Z0R9_ARAHY|nr:hypothetical protein Ahy_B05g075241 [Arachis hypogaea]
MERGKSTLRADPEYLSIDLQLDIMTNEQSLYRLKGVAHIAGAIVDEGLCKTRHTSAAIQVLRKIPMHGIVPNVVMYSAIIDSLCKVGLVNLAFRVFSDMLAKGISIDVQSYNIMINGLKVKCSIKP